MTNVLKNNNGAIPRMETKNKATKMAEETTTCKKQPKTWQSLGLLSALDKEIGL
jgi:hypothetical protein